MADRSDDGESVSDPGQPVDGLSYMFLIVTGALQSIPADLVEAAKIDGANTFQVWRNVTLPQLMIALTPLLIASFAFNFNNFNLIYMLNSGGPSMTDARCRLATPTS